MNRFRFALLGLGLLLTVSAAEAQGPSVRATIPFDFAVGDQVLPAGEYVVSPEGVNVAIAIRSTEGGGTVLSTTQACTSALPSQKTQLVFHLVGGRYFLSQIWAQGYSNGRQLPKSKAETRLAKNQDAQRELFIAAKLNR
jgi:hypothetical protein